MQTFYIVFFCFCRADTDKIKLRTFWHWDTSDSEPSARRFLIYYICLCGSYLALVTGPFGNLSSDFSIFVDFIARERALQTMELNSGT